MKLSVITINYNNLSGLKKTLESIFEQTFQDFEFIIIDGGSKDGSRELISSYADKVDYWVSERDSGVYNAMNKGIARATGDYVIHMNSGDTFFDQRTLELAVPELSSGEDIIYGDAFFFNRINDEPDSLWVYPKKLSFDFFRFGSLNHQAVFLKTSLLQRQNGYSESYRIVSDWFFMLEALVYNAATFKHNNLTVCRYDQSGVSALNWDKAVVEREAILSSRFLFFYTKCSEAETGPVNKKRIPLHFKRIGKKILKMLLPYGFVRYWQKSVDR